jgi:CheY-like chemotaxis protein
MPDPIVPPGITVLIVEDNELLIDFYRQALSGLGDISVVIARNGYEGLIEVCAHQPQIVIADLSMPQFDGFKMLRILDNDPKHRPAHFIVVSGLGEEEITSAGGLPQGSHLIPKKQLTSALIHELVSQQSGAMKIGQ